MIPQEIFTASAEDKTLDLRLSHNVQEMADFRYAMHAAVEGSVPSSLEGLRTYRVALFQDRMDGLEGVTAYVARVLEGKGRAAQWIGNAMLPQSVRLLVTSRSREALRMEIRRQLVTPCAAAMFMSSPQVVMLN